MNNFIILTISISSSKVLFGGSQFFNQMFLDSLDDILLSSSLLTLAFVNVLLLGTPLFLSTQGILISF
jgi:hypothetical protein